eukprot:scaffold3553_cov180-Ochromonas_danica.AAC.14
MSLCLAISMIWSVHGQTTLEPTLTPSFSPSAELTMSPSLTPSETPTLSPTVTPTMTPTLKPTDFMSQYQLFAIVGGYECSQALFYGPAQITTAGSDDNHPYYLCTAPSYGTVDHNEWLQIVTTDGDQEVFRIFWHFSTPKTLSAHFVNAYQSGEDVSYRVVDTAGVAGGLAGQNYYYNGTWRYSSTSSITAFRFGVDVTTFGFSSANGVWGAGQGVIDGNNAKISARFWGQGNFRGSDYDNCRAIYVNGTVYSNSYLYSKSFFYLRKEQPNPTAAPTRKPSLPPTLLPSYVPTRLPTVSPSAVPTIAPSGPTAAPTVFEESYELYAIIGGNQCAEALYYGPSPITTSGSADGHAYYLSTATDFGTLPHSSWLQIVTSNGVNELFRIYWIFSSEKTLSKRFVNAYYLGETVTYKVVDTSGMAGSVGQEYVYSGIWWFSDDSAMSSSRFSVSSSTLGFSMEYGVWGGGNGKIDGSGNVPGTFWGQGNFQSTDAASCGLVYANGIAYSLYAKTSASFLYVVKSGSNRPSQMPSVAPTISLSPSMRPTPSPSAVPTASPTTEFPSSLVMTNQISFANVTVNRTLSENAVDAILTTVANTLNVQKSQVSLTNYSWSSATAVVAAAATPSFVLRGREDDRSRSLMMEVMAEGSVLVVETQTTVAVQDYPTFRNNATALYTYLSTTLTSAVTQGSFVNELKTQATALSVPELTTATAQGVSSSYVEVINIPPTASPTRKPDSSSSSSSKKNMTMIIIIVIVAVVGGLAAISVIACLAASSCKASSSSSPPNEGRVGTSRSRQMVEMLDGMDGEASVASMNSRPRLAASAPPAFPPGRHGQRAPVQSNAGGIHASAGSTRGSGASVTREAEAEARGEAEVVTVSEAQLLPRYHPDLADAVYTTEVQVIVPSRSSQSQAI